MAEHIQVKVLSGKTLSAWVNFADLLRYEGISQDTEIDGVEVEVEVDNPSTGEVLTPIIMPLISFLDLWELMYTP